MLSPAAAASAARRLWRLWRLRLPRRLGIWPLLRLSGMVRLPGFYGLGLGLGLGYGLGYGYGGGYGGYGGYGYGGYGGYGYPYSPYPAGSPVYVNPSCGPTAPVAAAPYAVAGQGAAPAVPAGPAPGAPIRLTDSDMLLSIRVPPNALVRINGENTNQNGPHATSCRLACCRAQLHLRRHRSMDGAERTSGGTRTAHPGPGRRTANVDFLMPPIQQASFR